MEVFFDKNLFLVLAVNEEDIFFSMLLAMKDGISWDEGKKRRPYDWAKHHIYCVTEAHFSVPVPLVKLFNNSNSI